MAPITDIPTQITNTEFAERVGLHHTMASRLRNGERLPSLPTFIRTMRAFELDCDETLEWLDAVAKGSEASGAWLRQHVFSPRADAASLPEAG